MERVAALAELVTDTPEVVVDLDVVRENIARIALVAAEAGVSVRPHIKTHKLPAIAQHAGRGGRSRRSGGEARRGRGDGRRRDRRRARRLPDRRRAEARPAVRSRGAGGDLDHRRLARGRRGCGAGGGGARARRSRCCSSSTPVCTGSGVVPGPAAVELAVRVAALGGLELRGVFTHEGHVYTQARDPAEKERLTLESCRAAVETAEAIRARGLPAPVVSVGSAGTFRFAIRCPGVTEVRPGTYVFNDRSQLAQGAATADDLAAFVVATVVSRPAPDRVVVDAGSKVLTSDRMLVPDAPLSFGAVWGRDDWDVVRLSEEHGVLSVPPDARVRVGDRIAIVPNHICPVINLASELTVVEDGELVGRWPVAARGLVR